MLGIEASRLGVDLGTTHTVAALAVRGARVQQLLFDSSPLLSSAVYAEEGRRMVAGRDAERAARIDPTRFEPNPKRRIDDGNVLLGDREYPVADLLAAILRRVADEAGRVGGGSPGATVLTYPANWATTRRGVLAEAAQRAGLRSLTLVPEPIAAAAYFTTVLGRPVPPGAGLVVYDLGAGTFDTSVLRRRPDQGWEVLSSEGVDVGGLDLDAEVVEVVGEAMSARDAARWAQLRDGDDDGIRRMRRALWDDARAAKEQLSRAPSAAVHVPLFDTHAHVTREQFEERARPWLARTVELTAVAVARAGLAPGQITGLFLVGGSSRIPLVGTMLHQRLGVAPTVIEQPELVVALGSLAAVPAGAPPYPVPPPFNPAGVAPMPPTPMSPSAGAPMAPTPMSPAAAAPVSGTPVSGSPMSAPPGVTSPTSGPPMPPSGPPMPLWPDPVTPGPGPAAPRRKARTGLALAAAAAAVLLLGVGGVTGYQLLSGDSDNGGDRGGGNQGANPNGGQSSISVGEKVEEPAAAGAARQTIKIDKTIWYEGRKITLGEAAYNEADDPPLTISATVENLTDRPAYPSIDMSLSLDGQSYQGRPDESQPVPANAKSNAVYGFKPERAPGQLADGVLTVGGGGEVRAVVPFKEGGGEFVSLEPKPVVTNQTVRAGALSMTVSTCEVRADDLENVRQAKDKQRFLSCLVDLKFHGYSDRRGGQNIDNTNFRLLLPDKQTVEAPAEFPIELLDPNEVAKGQYVVFTLSWPAPGDYTVQLLDLGYLNHDKPTPGKTGNVPVKIA